MPYIKPSYDERNGWDEIRGYLERSKLPDGIAIEPAPAEDPIRPMNKEDYAASLRAKGVNVTENRDGSLTLSKPRRNGR